MLYAQETTVNQTRGHIIGESPVFEAFTDSAGALFRGMQREHGRCASAVYIDSPTGQPKRIGWVFEKLDHYSDTGEPFMRETWITLHEKPDTVVREHHYLDLDA